MSMSTSAKRLTCMEALELWGPEAQTLMVFEEMSELQKELCKHARGRDNREAIAEEIADVRIMLEQMCILHNCDELAAEYEEKKLERLRDTIEKEAKRKGRPVVFPCKVGDILWDRSAEPWKVISLEWFDINVVHLHCVSPVTGRRGTLVVGKKSIGKTVFLTREEAEKALEGGQADA